jgi:hypothetical protein
VTDTVTNRTDVEISKKLNVLIALSLRELTDDKDFSMKGNRKGAGDLVRYLASMGLDAKDIAQIVGSPLTSVRTPLTPTRRK